MSHVFVVHCFVCCGLKNLFAASQLKKKRPTPHVQEEGETREHTGFLCAVLFLHPAIPKRVLCDCCHHAQTACLDSVRLRTSSPCSIRCPCKPCTNSRKSLKTWWCRVSFWPRIFRFRSDGGGWRFCGPQVWPGETTSPRTLSVGSWVMSPPSPLPSNLAKKWLTGSKCTARTQPDTIQYQSVSQSLISRLLEPSQQRAQAAEDMADPDVMQQYVDYMILDPSQSSARMQAPLLDPYTYRQVRGDPLRHTSHSFIFCLNLILP